MKNMLEEKHLKKLKEKKFMKSRRILLTMFAASLLLGLLSFFGGQPSASAHTANALLKQCTVDRGTLNDSNGILDGTFRFPLASYPDRQYYDYAQVYRVIDPNSSAPHISVEAVTSGVDTCPRFIDVDMYRRPLPNGETVVDHFEVVRRIENTNTQVTQVLRGTARTWHIDNPAANSVQNFKVRACYHPFDNPTAPLQCTPYSPTVWIHTAA